MAIYLTYAMPMPAIVSPGGAISLTSLLTQSFGGVPAGWGQILLAHASAGYLSSNNFDYWDPHNGALSLWTVNGSLIAYDARVSLPRANFGGTVYHGGNAIGPLSAITVPLGGADDAFIDYTIYSIPAALMSPTAGNGAPTPQDIVASAHRFNDYYGAVDNDFDCHFIAGAVAAAAGAVFTATGTADVDNTALNIEFGFWRIAYRGTSTGVSNWETLLQPGDIVRFSRGGFHTYTMLEEVSSGQWSVYDNTASGGDIGIHTVDPDASTRRDSVTIYRLTTDNLFLINGSNLGDRIDGTIFNDRLVGRNGADVLDGRGGADVLQGGAGGDTYVIGAGDRIIETATGGVDLVRSGVSHTLAANVENLTLVSARAINGAGNAGANTMTGNNAGNVLNGGAGNDRVAGAGGADTIIGGPGLDTLTGGAGADRFVLNVSGAANRDAITDFAHGVDKVHLENSVFTALGAAGALSAAAFHVGASAHDASDRIIYNSATGVLYYDRDGTGGAAQVQIATLTGHPGVAVGDFVVI
jgi:Ca2+-binding RTX toxin-like protein